MDYYLGYILITFVILAISRLFWKWKCLTNYKFPPGPPCFPVIGSILYMIGDPRVVFNKLRDKYGDIYTVYKGNVPMVVLSGYETIKDCFVKRGAEFANRPELFYFEDVLKKGRLTSSGPVWKEQRTFTIKVLRKFGMGKSLMEDHILEEAKYLYQALRETKEKPAEINSCLEGAFANVISAVLYNRRFQYGNSSLVTTIKNIKDYVNIVGQSVILNLYPSLRHLPGDLTGYKAALKKVMGDIKLFYGPIIDEHRKQLDPQNIRDFVDAYLVEADQCGSESSFSVSSEQLASISQELFGAGVETGSTTLSWAVVILLNHAEIQNKLQQTVDAFPVNQPIYYRDRRHFPYIEAFVDELQRFADIVPLGVPHATSCDVSFRGYHIPEGSIVMANLSSVHGDPQLWPDPKKFDPNRFLDEDGNHLRREELVPFSLGYRICVGEALARMEQFMFIAGLMQNFTLLPSDSEQIPSMEGEMKLVHRPVQFKVRCQPRHRKTYTY